ncbi:MAG: ferritin-like domain-containing protein [Acetobacteraceae bacterium]|nr:ferritin-like domain-containing protein [Acetobacteraceae bacterium]
MQVPRTKNQNRAERRWFLKNVAVGGATIGAGLLAGSLPGFGQEEQDGGTLNSGDVAILRFLAAAEIIESDLWLQYAELGGTQDSELPGLPTKGSGPYTDALSKLDGDMPQYIHDNTEDELTHQAFINAYLVSKGFDPVNLDQFRTLPSSKATGANQIGRLTNLMQLTVDTSWWTRYRSRDHNPDLDPGFRFPPAVPSLSNGQFPAIPRSDDDLAPPGHIQAIANTAAFHFAWVEQGGTSLYPTLAQNVTNPEVLRILLSIGPTETMHFQTWHDKAGNAVSDPLAPLTDPNNPDLVFPNLNTSPGGEDFQTNLIMPEACPFLSRKFPAVSIIRPTSTRAGGAVAAAKGFIADGLFIGQPKQFVQALMELASDADAAQRGSA